MEILTLYSNFIPNSNNFDEKGIGIYHINGRYTAVVLRTYYDF